MEQSLTASAYFLLESVPCRASSGCYSSVEVHCLSTEHRHPGRHPATSLEVESHGWMEWMEGCHKCPSTVDSLAGDWILQLIFVCGLAVAAMSPEVHFLQATVPPHHHIRPSVKPVSVNDQDLKLAHPCSLMFSYQHAYCDHPRVLMWQYSLRGPNPRQSFPAYLPENFGCGEMQLAFV